MSQPLDINITENDRLLLSLRDRQLRTLFETTLDAIAITDDQGRYLDVNPAACELFGLARDELLGRCIAEFATPGFDFQGEWQEFQEQEKVRGEFQLVRADGEIRVVEYAATANFLPHRHLSVMRDITEQQTALREYKQAEARVQKLTAQLEAQNLTPVINADGITSEISNVTDRVEAKIIEITQLQQAILDGANYTIISTDTEGVIKTINAAAQKALGYAAAEVVDQFTPAIFHDLEEINQRAAELTKELGKTILPGFEVFIAKAQLGMIDDYEWSYIRRDGSRFPAQLSITALRNEEGIIIGFLGIGRDISEQKTALRERKLAESALADSEAQNRAILQAIPDLMFRVDRAGIYLSYSKPTEIFCALCDQEAVGKPMIEFLPSEVYQSHKYYMELALETKQIQIYEQEITIAGRVQQEEVRVVPIEDKEEILFIVRDISDRKRTEAALAESEAQNQAMLQAIPDIMFRLNKAGIYLEYTTSTEFLDLSNPQSVGKPMADDLSPEHYQRHMRNLAIALETGQIQTYEQEVTIEGQIQYEEVRVVPLDDREEVLFMIRDIGDRKRAETSNSHYEKRKGEVMITEIKEEKTDVKQ